MRADKIAAHRKNPATCGVLAVVSESQVEKNKVGTERIRPSAVPPWNIRI